MTLNQWQDFQVFFANHYPELDKKFPSKSLVNGQPFVTQPAIVKNEEYEEFNKIMEEWRNQNNAY